MTRRDCELVAKALRDSFESDYNYDISQYENTVWYVARAFKNATPRFNWDKFNEACGLGVSK